MQIGLGTIYLLIILAKILGLIELGWFAVITSFIWLPILAALCALLAFGIGWLLVVGVIFIYEVLK